MGVRAVGRYEEAQKNDLLKLGKQPALSHS